jgi:hypothetical protein
METRKQKKSYMQCAGTTTALFFSQLPSLDTHDASTLVYNNTSQDRVWSMIDRLVRLGSESGLSLGVRRSIDETKAFFSSFVFFFCPLPGQLLKLIVICYHSPVVHNLNLSLFWCRHYINMEVYNCGPIMVFLRGKREFNARDLVRGIFPLCLQFPTWLVVDYC